MKQAKIIPFGRRPTPPPMTKKHRTELIESLLELAVLVEDGKIADVNVAYVQSDGKTGHVYLLPRDPRKLLVSIQRSKDQILHMLEEDGPR